MIISTNLDDLHTTQPCAVALGAFDGLHRGHRVLIDRLLLVAGECGLCSMVFTFDPHPDRILHPDKPLPMLMTKAEKEAVLDAWEVDALHYQDFDEKFHTMAPERFIDFLVTKLDTKVVIAGYDYCFGYQGKGNADALVAGCRERGIEAVIISPVHIDGTVVSSTRIRRALGEGDIAGANHLLGYPYAIHGVVSPGRSRGRTLGFPTANITMDNTEKMLPAGGVYITQASFGDRHFYALTNVGVNPTFERDHAVRIETHIPRFTGELYGEKMELRFLERLRDEKAFDSGEALIGQLQRDLASFEKFVYKKKDM